MEYAIDAPPALLDLLYRSLYGRSIRHVSLQLQDVGTTIDQCPQCQDATRRVAACCQIEIRLFTSRRQMPPQQRQFHRTFCQMLRQGQTQTAKAAGNQVDGIVLLPGLLRCR